MKWINKQLSKWWVWLVITVLFLATVHVLFKTEAPYEWLEAVWEAGDIISLVGTLVLGYIAMLQTQRANDMAEDANKTSRKLIELQKAEYTPVVTIKSFAGITKHSLEHANLSGNSQMFVHEMRCDDGEVLVGYSISLIDEEYDKNKDTYCRDYEIHLNYSGHFVVESFQIKEIRFLGSDFERIFKVESTNEISLGCDEEFKLFLFLISNNDFLQEDSFAHQYINASHVIFKIEMKSISGETYKETIKVRKLLVKEPSPKLQIDNAELLVSASYQVDENITPNSE